MCKHNCIILFYNWSDLLFSQTSHTQGTLAICGRVRYVCLTEVKCRLLRRFIFRQVFAFSKKLIHKNQCVFMVCVKREQTLHSCNYTSFKRKKGKPVPPSPLSPPPPPTPYPQAAKMVFKHVHLICKTIHKAGVSFVHFL